MYSIIKLILHLKALIKINESQMCVVVSAVMDMPFDWEVCSLEWWENSFHFKFIDDLWLCVLLLVPRNGISGCSLHHDKQAVDAFVLVKSWLNCVTTLKKWIKTLTKRQPVLGRAVFYSSKMRDEENRWDSGKLLGGWGGGWVEKWKKSDYVSPVGGIQ